MVSGHPRWHDRFPCRFLFFFFNDTATTEIYTLSLHDALPILNIQKDMIVYAPNTIAEQPAARRSEEHTSELQSRFGISYAVFCLKKKTHDSSETKEVTPQTYTHLLHGAPHV